MKAARLWFRLAQTLVVALALGLFTFFVYQADQEAKLLRSEIRDLNRLVKEMQAPAHSIQGLQPTVSTAEKSAIVSEKALHSNIFSVKDFLDTTLLLSRKRFIASSKSAVLSEFQLGMPQRDRPRETFVLLDEKRIWTLQKAPGENLTPETAESQPPKRVMMPGSKTFTGMGAVVEELMDPAIKNVLKKKESGLSVEDLSNLPKNEGVILSKP